MSNPTAEEMVEIAKSGNTGAVKTLTDIRFEKLEARLAAVEAERDSYKQTIEEFRNANAEMFAFISSQSKPAAAPSVSASNLQPPQAQTPVSAQVMTDQNAAIAQKQRDEANLAEVQRLMGYSKPKQSISDTNIPQDGM